jgi:hypothetical protein
MRSDDELIRQWLEPATKGDIARVVVAMRKILTAYSEVNLAILNDDKMEALNVMSRIMRQEKRLEAIFNQVFPFLADDADDTPAKP